MAVTYVSRRNVVGVLLAGGKSQRMGKDKALLEFRGAPMAAWCAAALAQCAPTLIVSSATATHARAVARAVADSWPKFTVMRGVQVFEAVDQTADAGPLGGLVTAWKSCEAPWSVVSACDTPLVPAEFYRRAVSMLEEHHAVAPQLERPEPLVSAWRRSEALAAAGPLMIQRAGPHMLLERVHARLVLEPELRAWGIDPRLLASANSPQALGRLEALASGSEG
jgi:molybdopterin-guanine dinucleotide biosynthesis protein A